MKIFYYSLCFILLISIGSKLHSQEKDARWAWIGEGATENDFPKFYIDTTTLVTDEAANTVTAWVKQVIDTSGHEAYNKKNGKNSPAIIKVMNKWVIYCGKREFEITESHTYFANGTVSNITVSMFGKVKIIKGSMQDYVYGVLCDN